MNGEENMPEKFGENYVQSRKNSCEYENSGLVEIDDSIL